MAIFCYVFTVFLSVSTANVLNSRQEFDFVSIFDSFQSEIDYLKADKQDMELNIAMLLEERGLVSHKFKNSEKKIEACESKMSKMAIQIAENSEELSAITYRVDEQEQKLLEITDKLSQLKKSLVPPLKIKILEGRVNKLEGLQVSLEKDMKNTIGYLEQTFLNLTHHMDYLNNQTLDLEEKIETFGTIGSPIPRQTTRVSYIWLNKSQSIEDISLQELLSSAQELPNQVDYESVENEIIVKDLNWIQMDLSSVKLKQWALQSQMLQNRHCNCTSVAVSPNVTDSLNHASFTLNEEANYIGELPNEIELLVVVDYEAYLRWYEREGIKYQNGRDIKTQQAITKYVTSLVHDMNDLYHSLEMLDLKIEITLVDILIIQSKEGGYWLSKSAKKGFPRNIVHAGSSLASFYRWVKKHENALPPHDHAMLLTGFDLQSKNEAPNKLTTGHAYLGTMCKRSSVSVVENQFNFEDVVAASHELAHSLGSEHDGDGNSCPDTEGYIMAPVIEVNATNRWSFSACSHQYIQDLLEKLHREKRNCLSTKNNLGHMPQILDADIKLGALLSPDRQCALIEGPGSFLCRDFYQEYNYHTLCREMWCNNITSPTPTCNTFLGSDGFSCGNQKICVQGECVFEQTAPVVLDLCPLGDEPGIVWNNYTCPEIAENAPEQCYDDVTRMKCCLSCQKIHNGDPECPYGDRSSWCRTDLELPVGCYLNEDLCCSTCAKIENENEPDCPYGDRSKWCNTTLSVPIGCYENEDLCCETCKKHIDHQNPECPYGDRSTWCSTTMEAPFGCYKNSELCCGTCAEYHQPQNIGCEYGDKSTWCVNEMNVPSGCYLNNDLCCGTCNQYYNSTNLGCEYGDKHTDCSKVPYPMGCYKNSALCCGSCADQKRHDRPGCEFGDKSTWCTNHLKPEKDCELNRDLCCGTCVYKEGHHLL